MVEKGRKKITKNSLQAKGKEEKILIDLFFTSCAQSHHLFVVACLFCVSNDGIVDWGAQALPREHCAIIVMLY
jgi:hypothetical protein